MFGQAREGSLSTWLFPPIPWPSQSHSLYCLPKISHFLRNATPSLFSTLSFPSSSTTTAAPVGWPAGFVVVVAVSESKNKWRGEKAFSRKTLPACCLSVCHSDESTLIWLNVAQSWQFTPSESRLLFPPSKYFACGRVCLIRLPHSQCRLDCRDPSWSIK